MFVEVVYETGASSVMEVASKAEALRALGEQHKRAKSGGSNGPQGGPAERVVRAFVYSDHPNNYNPGDALTKDELKKVLPKLIDEIADANGVVPVGALAVEVRGLTHPMLNSVEPHTSIYRMEEEGEITAEEIEKASDSKAAA